MSRFLGFILTVLPAAQLRSKIDSNTEDSSSGLTTENKSSRKSKSTFLKESSLDGKQKREEKLAKVIFKGPETSQVKIPSSQIPCCSRCGTATKMVNGANFVSEGLSASSIRPFTLWHCDYCSNYEITKPSFFLLLKRVIGYRKGSDVSFKIERRPTFTRHGKISILNDSSNCICYIPVKSHM